MSNTLLDLHQIKDIEFRDAFPAYTTNPQFPARLLRVYSTQKLSEGDIFSLDVTGLLFGDVGIKEYEITHASNYEFAQYTANAEDIHYGMNMEQFEKTPIFVYQVRLLENA